MTSHGVHLGSNLSVGRHGGGHVGLGDDTFVGKDGSVASREEILDEIRRTATANGGRPIGRSRFRELTGISEYALAQHWATYGDAVREAGLEPNKLQGQLDRDRVIRQLIELVRALGHVPTSNELRRARAADPSFPTTGVFERLGSKDERVAKALEACRVLPDYEDVEGILEAYLAERGSEDNAGSTADVGPPSYGSSTSLAAIEASTRLDIPTWSTAELLSWARHPRSSSSSSTRSRLMTLPVSRPTGIAGLRRAVCGASGSD